MSRLMMFALLAAVFGPLAQAAEEAPPPPPMPPEGADADALEEPEVRIVEKADATVAEYRLRGKLYMMKVTPRVGPAYYLIDREGNGRFDRMDGGGTHISVPQWVLFSW